MPSVITIGTASHLAGAAMFLLLAILLLTGWRGRLQGGILVAAAVMNCLWCLVLAYAAARQAVVPYQLLFSSEMLRSGLWLVFLLRLLESGYGDVRFRRIRNLLVGLWAVVLATGVIPGIGAIGLPGGIVIEHRILGLLLLTLVGLTLVEQLYRNATAEQRWALKFLCFGLGGMFVYDLILYANALLFVGFDQDMWNARGAVNALVVPFIAISVARNPQWSLEVFVSRRFVFYGATLIAAGLLLIGVAAGGYYVRLYGGDWGTIAQVIVVFASLMGLLSLAFSGQVRARVRVFLSKHFYNYKYDYRDEWLRLIRTIAEGPPAAGMRQRVIQALAQIVDGTNGRLWMRDGDGNYACVADWNLAPPVAVVGHDDPLVCFLRERNWVIDLREQAAGPERYPGFGPPAWLAGDPGAWLVIPLRHHDELAGFVLVGKPRVARETNWEDWDLLKTAGRQAAGYLALLEASEALTEARQFEAFNRLSAFVVHDLKNMVAQLSLVVSNARHHIEKPEFVSDAIRTVENTAERMNRLLAQLRKTRFEPPVAVPVRLDEIMETVVARRCASRPAPSLHVDCRKPVLVMSDPDRLASVLEHLVQNAQEATGEDGGVSCRLDRDGPWARIRISDDGVGMDPDFIRDRLFRPFDTTKGNAGMGVGVYDAREFVLTLKGRMRVDSEVGRGTTFTILIPPADNPVGEEHTDRDMP